VFKVSQEHNSFLRVCPKSDQEKLKSRFDAWPLFRARRWALQKFFKVQHFVFLLVKDKKCEALFLSAIVANMAMMVLSDANDPDSVLNQTETIFFGVFLSELGLKMLGMGIFAPKTGFFRDFWNVLDFFIVGFTGLNLLLVSMEVNLSALRTLRVLRPLKTISSVKKLRTLILTIFGSLPFLLDIVFMLVFIYLIYAIAGVHLFGGNFKWKCVSPVTLAVVNPGMVCSADISCPGISLCLSDYQNLELGLTSFDSVASGAFLVHELITCNGFSNLFLVILGQDTVMQVITIVFYISLIFVGSFLTLNLMLAVIVVKFTEANNSNAGGEKAHDSNCLCSKGFNFQLMKDCGYFLSLSQLKKNRPLQAFVIKYTYAPLKEQEKERDRVVFQRDYSFWTPGAEAKKPSNIRTGASAQGGILSVFQKMKTHRSAQRNAELRLQKKANLGGPRFPRFQESQEQVDPSELSLVSRSQLILGDPRSGPIPLCVSVVLEGKTPDPQDAPGRLSDHSLDLFEFGAATSNLMASFANQAGPCPAPRPLCKSETGNVKVLAKLRPGALPPRTRLSIQFDQDFQKAVEVAVQVDKPPLCQLTLGPIKEEAASANSRHDDTHNSEEERGSQGSFEQVVENPRAVGGRASKSQPLRVPEGLLSEESEGVFASEVNDLDLFFNMCKSVKALKYLAPRKDIFPRLQEFKTQVDLNSFHQAIIDNTVQVTFDFKRLVREEQAENPKRPVLLKKPQEAALFLALTSPGFSSLADRKIQVSRFQTDFVRVHSFYFYCGRVNRLRLSDPQPDQLPDESLNPHRANKNNDRQSSLRLKSRNFQSMKKFFEEDFPPTAEATLPNELGPEREYNTKMYSHIVRLDLKSGEKASRVWSGPQVSFTTKVTSLRTASVFAALNHEVHDIWLRGFYGKTRTARRLARNLILNKTTENVLMFLVILNVVFLSLDGIADSTYSHVSSVLNFVFTVLFIIETALKLFGLGAPRFSQTWFNIIELGHRPHFVRGTGLHRRRGPGRRHQDRAGVPVDSGDAGHQDLQVPQVHAHHRRGDQRLHRAHLLHRHAPVPLPDHLCADRQPDVRRQARLRRPRLRQAPALRRLLQQLCGPLFGDDPPELGGRAAADLPLRPERGHSGSS
jgi:hypothetical protein